MFEITTIGVDLSKNVFQVHGADASGRAVFRKRFRRSRVFDFFSGLPPCLVAMEACAGAHHFARELRAMGHEVRLIPPQYVKPFVKTQKNDAADAEAICEAAQRPTMRFAPVKSAEQQSVLMIHRVRDLLVRQRTMLINALRGHLNEFGIVVAQGRCNVGKLIEIVEEQSDERLPALARQTLGTFVEQLHHADRQIAALESRLKS
jgi:transposase